MFRRLGVGICNLSRNLFIKPSPVPHLLKGNLIAGRLSSLSVVPVAKNSLVVADKKDGFPSNPSMSINAQKFEEISKDCKTLESQLKHMGANALTWKNMLMWKAKAKVLEKAVNNRRNGAPLTASFTFASLLTQDAAAPLMEEVSGFHEYVLSYEFGLTLLVVLPMVNHCVRTNFTHRFFTEHQGVEFVWTIVPIILLLFIAIPSLRILYLMDDAESAVITVKCVGHQWYWSYEYSDFSNISFDSYMVGGNLGQDWTGELD